ncbi:outer membrane beta-barrel protein [Candidatus Latescibacterota bacterium]
MGTGLLFSNEVYAQNKVIMNKDEKLNSKNYEISPIIGVFIFEDNSYDNSIMFGVRSLVNITKKYAIEGEIGFSPSTFTYGIDYENSDITTIKEDLKIYNYCSNFIYKYILSESIYSYGTFGIGGISFLLEESDSNTDLYFNFGGGIKLLFREKFAFRIDIRQYAPSFDIRLISPRSGNIYFKPEGSPKADVQKIIQLNLGITFLFK